MSAFSYTKIKIFDFIEYEIKLRFTGYKFTFADASYVMDIDQFKNMCYGINWSTEGLVLDVNVQTQVQECSYGIIGI